MVCLRKSGLLLSLVSFCFVLANTENVEDDLLVDELLEHCPVTNPIPTAFGEICETKLDAYFLDDVVWKYLELPYYSPSIEPPTIGPAFNVQTGLRIRELEKMRLGLIPRWRDIFDEKIEMRDILVTQVFQDEACKSLTNGLIRPALKERCSSEELYRYATYLDMCLTGLHRYDWLIQRKAIFGGRSFAEYGLEVISRNTEAEHNVDSSAFKRGILNSVWLTQKCSHMPVSAFDENLKRYVLTEQLGFRELAKIFIIGHDAAMNIAVRTGHKQALYSYNPPPVSSDVDYWKSLFRIEPYLVHYWLAYGRSHLSDTQQMLHAVRAYTIQHSEFTADSFDSYLEDFGSHLSWPDAPSSNPLVQRIFKVPGTDLITKEDLVVEELLEYPW